LDIGHFDRDEYKRIPVWQFDAKTGIDWPFHALTSFLGKELTLTLDDIVLDTPLRAAARATQIYQTFYQACRSKLSDEKSRSLVGTRDVMNLLGQAMASQKEQLDDAALLPPQTVFKG